MKQHIFIKTYNPYIGNVNFKSMRSVNSVDELLLYYYSMPIEKARRAGIWGLGWGGGALFDHYFSNVFIVKL